jgi:hypothetical protein
MEDWEKRLVAEYHELTERIKKLDAAINNTRDFARLNSKQTSLLRVQSAAMKTYQSILMERMIDIGIAPTANGNIADIK